ncbi:MAG: hypothetical protein R2788_09885 [Saprospiraceae bacterium]
MTIYNQRIMRELGLDSPPQTYSDYLAVAKNFKDNDGDGYIDQWFGHTSVRLAYTSDCSTFYPLYLAASGGMPLIKDAWANFHTSMPLAFRFLQELYRENYFSKQMQTAGQDMFVSENMRPNGLHFGKSNTWNGSNGTGSSGMVLSDDRTRWPR